MQRISYKQHEERFVNRQDSIGMALFCNHAMCLDGLESLCREDPTFELALKTPEFEISEIETSFQDVDFLLLCATCNRHLLERPHALMKQIHREYPHTFVVVLNSTANRWQTRALLKSGIRRVISAQVGLNSLVRILNGIVSGESAENHHKGLDGGDDSQKRTLFDLSTKEVQILKVMASGITNHEIGKRLLLTEATVKSYLHRIFHKMDAKTRTQAVVKALKHSII